MNKAAKFVVREIPIVTHEELAGLGMIQRLSRVKGGERSFTDALAEWRKMKPSEQEATRLEHALLNELWKWRN